MSTAVLTSTSFPGMDITYSRMPKWETRVQENVAGHETRVALRTIPRWTWELKFNFLRNSTAYNSATVGSSEYASLNGFFNARAGGFDSWQWLDPQDNIVSTTVTGSGSSIYQLQRTLGGFTENVLAPSSSWAATVDSSAVTTTTFFWGSSVPGQIQFSTLNPTSTMTIAVSGSYYWPVRFDADTMQFERMMNNLWELKKVSFTSII